MHVCANTSQMADAYMFMKLEKNLFKLPGGAYLCVYIAALY